MLLLLVPETMLTATPGLRERLNINTNRLIGPFDLHHTLQEFAKTTGENTAEHTEATTDDLDPAAAAGIERINFFKDLVPEDRPCKQAGIEKILCVCDAWVPCAAADLPAVEYQATEVVLPLLNDRLRKVLRSFVFSKESLTQRCAQKLIFSNIGDAETSASPPTLQFVLTVKAEGTRDVLFSVSLVCEDDRKCTLRKGKCSGDEERFVVRTSSVCKVATIDRLTSMLKAEDAVYKSVGKTSSGGKLCVVP